MVKGLEEKLLRKGYRALDLESLFDELPENIWITISDKNIKRKNANFVFTKREGKWVGSLNVMQEDEIYVIHRIVEKKIIDAVAKMLLFVDDNKMLGPDI